MGKQKNDAPMTELTLERLLQIKASFQFLTNMRDFQLIGTCISWASQSGISIEEFLSFCRTVPVLFNIERVGYFEQAPSIEHARAISDFEKTVPPFLKKQLRKKRLTSSFTGKVGGNGKGG